MSAAYPLTLGGRVASAALNVVSLLVLVRVLPPEGVGIFSLAISTIAILATIADAGLRTGFIRRVAQAARHPADVALTSASREPPLDGVFAVEHALGLVLGGGLILARRPFADAFFSGEASSSLVGAIALGVIAHNAYQIATAPSQARHDFRSFLAYQLAWALARLVGVALLAVAGIREPIAYILAHAASLAIAAVGVLAHDRSVTIRSLAGRWSGTSLRLAVSDLSSMHWVATGSLLFTAANQLGVFALGHWSSLGEVGRFAAVQRLVQVFQIAVSALWTVLLPRVLGFDRKALADYINTLRAGFPRAALLVLLGSGIASFALPFFIPPSLGDGRLVLLLLAGAALAEAYASLLSIVFLNLKAYHVVVFAAVAKLAVGILLASLWAPAWGAPGAAGACLVAEALCLAGLSLSIPSLLARTAGSGREDAPPGDGVRR